MPILVAYVIGVVFGLGILISGMANPAKVLNFFDVAGSWDPSLALVMGGALAVTFAGYRIVLRRSAPFCAPLFEPPTAKTIDARLLGGAAIFGGGWGVAGFCPGGALPALGTFRPEVALFVAAMIAGMMLTRLIQRSNADGAAAAKP